MKKEKKEEKEKEKRKKRKKYNQIFNIIQYQISFNKHIKNYHTSGCSDMLTEYESDD